MLYVLIAASFGTVFLKVWHGDLPSMVAVPFVLNLIANLAFSPIQFRLRSNALAALDVLLVLATLLWGLFALYVESLKLSISTGASDLLWILYANIPYLIWVSFATVLQLTVTYLNRR